MLINIGRDMSLLPVSFENEIVRICLKIICAKFGEDSTRSVATDIFLRFLIKSNLVNMIGCHPKGSPKTSPDITTTHTQPTHNLKKGSRVLIIYLIWCQDIKQLLRYDLTPRLPASLQISIDFKNQKSI